MWMEELPNGKYKFFERYKDPYTEKWKRVSATLSSGTSRAKKEAQKLLDEKIVKKEEKINSSDRLFQDVLEEWWSFYRKTVKPTTVKARTAPYNRIKSDFAIGTPIRNVDTAYIKKYIITCDLTKAQLKHFKDILNAVFDYAHEIKLVTENPARATKVPKSTADEVQIAINHKFLEQDELARLLKELYRLKRTYRAGLLAEFMSLNGCRIGEAVALELKNYRKNEGLLDIHGTLDSVDRHAEKTSTKTASGFRTTHLTKREMEILDEIIAMNALSAELNPDWPESDYIFLSKEGKPIQRNAFNVSLQKANARLKKPIKKHLSSHIFRHTLVSTLAESNVPLKAIMNRVGHKDARTTSQIYTHVTKSMEQAVLDALDTVALNRK